MQFLQDQPDLNMWLVEFENKEYVIINHTKKVMAIITWRHVLLFYMHYLS